MKENTNSKYQSALELGKHFLIILIIEAGLLAVLHYYFSDFRAGGIYWFNLDKERNLPTWFSGMLFFLFGCSGLSAYYWEKKQNEDNINLFRLPELWLGIAFIGFAMSLDEITILHENLFWKEVRNVSSKMDDSMKYVTQWQVLFAPVILLILGYFGLFFINRFTASRRAIYNAFAGISTWIFALLLEGIRQTFINSGSQLYSLQVLLEEFFEMLGAILLLYSIANYTIDIALDLNEKRKAKLSHTLRLLNKKSAFALGIIIVVLGLSGGIIYHFAKQQSVQEAPVPHLFKEAVDK